MSAFVQFEFDNDIRRLWQSIPSGGRNFAYHQRLANLTHEMAWNTSLDSLKTIDVLLSAIKSDLAGKNIGEERVMAHSDFVRLFVVLFYHVVAVIDGVLPNLTKSNIKPNLAIYSADGFGRVYARLFSSMQETTHVEFTSDELDGFYYGVGVLCQGVSIFGHEVATRLFILPIMAARLFGSMERTFAADLGNDGQKMGVAEDSLYWAVRDFIERIHVLQNSSDVDNHAKALFFTNKAQATTTNNHAPTSADKLASQAIVSQVVHSEQIPPSNQTLNTQNTQSINTHTLNNQSVGNQTSNIQTANTHAVTSAQILVQSSSQTPVIPQKTQRLSPSAYKRKARASHTPKLFLEAYQDLRTLNIPSDMMGEYQKASAILTKFDEFIDDRLSKGDLLDDIAFTDQQQNIRKQALSLLVWLIKQGNTSAMFRLALYYFEGRGVGIDVAKATMLTKRASEAGDIRAQKLLSRLYYQGFRADDGGVAMDVMLGEHWLKKAADGGHPEAKKVCAYMKQVEVLKDTYRTDVESNRRYGLLFVALMVGVALLLIMLRAMW